MSDEFKKDAYLGEPGEAITNENLAAYIEKYGEEKAIGYLQALNDFNVQLGVILGGHFVRGVQNSGHVVRKKLVELVDHNYNFLKSCQDDEQIKVQSKPSSPI